MSVLCHLAWSHLQIENNNDNDLVDREQTDAEVEVEVEEEKVEEEEEEEEDVIGQEDGEGELKRHKDRELWWFKLKPIIDHIRVVSQSYIYVLGSHLSIDEMMIRGSLVDVLKHTE